MSKGAKSYDVVKVLDGKRKVMTTKAGEGAERSANDMVKWLARTTPDGAQFFVVPHGGKSREVEDALAELADARASVLIGDLAGKVSS